MWRGFDASVRCSGCRTGELCRQVCAVLLTQVVPCPHLRSGQSSCSVWRSHVAKKIVQARWLPLVARYNVSLPVTCPLHPSRQLVLLDYHYWAEHPAKLTLQVSQQSWGTARADHPAELTLQVSQQSWGTARADHPAELTLQVSQQSWGTARADHPAELTLQVSQQSWGTARADHPAELTLQDETLVCPADFCGILRCSVYSHVLTSGRSDLETTDLQPQNESSLADQACDPVKMERLRIMCEDLVDDCISPLILDLSPEEFRTMQAELSHVTCWYLACDRYWDRSPAPARVLPWARIAAALTLPTLLLSYVYYLLCVLRLERRREPGKDFIQVTCPHELKRRLLERTVSREPARPRRPNDLFAIYDGDYELAPPNHVDY
ncbi:uncharacterized protein LOC119097219 [Pollicipes pollicipes]|uniref:uncharacterized protein LOC119097219 n=1 Tax=Pollicipes pollicipes TaxID=41117 RepID=UPI001884D77D|nr:uncharacterized protein LOC119097219 [Pollicipes pollicipes]